MVWDPAGTIPYYCAEFSRALKEKSVDVNLFSVGFANDPQLFVRMQVPVFEGLVGVSTSLHIKQGRLRKAVKGIEYLVNVLLARKAFRRRQPKVVHIQWLPFLPAAPGLEWLVLRSLRKTKCSLIYTVHNVLPHDTGDTHFHTYFRLYHRVDGLVTHTCSAKKELVSRFGVPSERIRVIPHGPLFRDDVQKISKEKARRNLGLGGDEYVVLFLGGMRPYKGVEFLLDAWEDYCKKNAGKRCVLLVAGSGDEHIVRNVSARVRAMQLDGWDVRAELTFLPPERVAMYHAAADVVVFPYKSITQSGALLTAMSFGKPVVVTDVGGIAEVVKEGGNGLVVSYGAVGELAAAISYLQSQIDVRASMGAASSRMIETKLSWSNIAKATIAFYREILSLRAQPQLEGDLYS